MKNSEKNGTGKKKKWRIPKDQVDYSQSEVFTLNEDLEIDGTLIVGYKDLEFFDLRDAAEELGINQHQLVRELQKKNCRLWLRFDLQSTRTVKIVPDMNSKTSIEYQINPGDIHQLTPDSIRRVERMLEKSELSFLDLMIEIQFGDLPLFVKITHEDEGMHLVILKDDLDLISKSSKTTNPLDDHNVKSNEKTSKESLDQMDQLLILINKNNPKWTAGKIWIELDREAMRRKRIYDKEEILLNFRDDKKDTLLWNSGRGKKKQSPLGKNTLQNRISKLRKAGLIE